MRGLDQTSGPRFSCVDLEARVKPSHPLRAMGDLGNASLAAIDASFEALYKPEGRPAIAPERLLRATLLQLLYSIREGSQLGERLESGLLFCWFVGRGTDDGVSGASSFSKNRGRLLTAAIAEEFLAALRALPQVKKLLSAGHFSAGGRILKGWLKACASMKSFRAKDGWDEPPSPGRNGLRDFKKNQRPNETRASPTDEDARLYRKGDGQESRFACPAHALMENRNGLAAGAGAALAAGTAARDAAAALTKALPGGASLGADKTYGAEASGEDLKARCAAHRHQQNGEASRARFARRRSRRRPRPAGCEIRMGCRKRIEEISGGARSPAASRS